MSQRAYQWKSMLVLTAAAVALAWLITRHASHLLQFLPFLVLLACPLMHLFHHRHRR